MVKNLLIVVFTAIYVIVAVLTYQADRELGRNNCWKDAKDNTAWSSIGWAAMWPVAAFIIGTTVITTNRVPNFDCDVWNKP